MSSIKKMVLVDPSQWEASAGLTNILPQPTPQQPLPDPLANSLSSLDQTMQAILQNTSGGDDYTKAQIYSQALQRYLRQADQFRERPIGKVTLKEIESVEEDKPEKDLEQQPDPAAAAWLDPDKPKQGKNKISTV